MIFPFPGITICMIFRLQVKFQKQWTKFGLMNSKILLQLFSTAWESSSILPSFLDLLIDNTIFIHLYQLVGPLPIPRPFNVMFWFLFSLLCKNNVISESTIQALLKSINPELFPNNQGSGRDFIIGSTSRNISVKLIDPRCGNFFYTSVP